MALAQTVSSLTHSLRKKEKIKVRQPLSKIMIPVLDEQTRHYVEAVEDLIKTEVNVKAVEFLDDTSGILVKKVKPNFRIIGKKFGPKVKFVAAAVNSWGQDEIAQIEREGNLDITVDGVALNLLLEDVEISSEDIPGWTVATEGKTTVALDIYMNDELRQEGFARDLVNRIQNLRKDKGLDVIDKISIQVSVDSEMIVGAVENFNAYIKEETQALSLEISGADDSFQQLDIDEIPVAISIEVTQ